jgi:hypothetical protein
VPIVLPTLVTLAVFILPGYAMVSILLYAVPLSLVDRVCIAIGTSLVIIPLLLLFCTTLGVRCGPSSIVVLLILSAGVIIGDIGRRHRIPQALTAFKLPISFEEWLLLLVFLVTLAFRLWAIRGQDFPAWTDGYHHTLISQIIRDTGFIPQSYRPYAPIDRFTYHFGFHSIVAAWAWLTALPTPKSTLIVAQIINSLVVPTLYIFAKTLTGRRDVGLLSAMVAGLVSIMPAYYVNWSRNTQLAGQTILPVALVAFIQILESPNKRWRWSALATLLLAGLFLTHYRVWGFVALFLVAYLVFRLPEVGLGRQSWQRLIWLAGSGFASTLLVMPWAWHIFREFLLPKHIAPAIESAAMTAARIETYRIYFAPAPLSWLLDQIISPFQLLIAFLGTLFGMLSHRRVILTLLTWVGLEFLVATPAWTGLPQRLALFNSFAVAIGLYLVTSIFIALFAIYVIDGLSTRWRSARPVLLLSALALTCVMAARWQPILLDPNQIFVTQADEAAMDWIATHTPADATFAIRPLFQLPASVIGVDGGYWLPYLAGRQVTIPPMVYFADGDDEYVADVFTLSKAISEVQSPAALAELLKERHIAYVYIGAREPDERREVLLASPQFESLYDQGGVTIFRVR